MADARARARRVLLVNPRFNGDSFWAYTPACRLVGARYPAPSLGLLTVAAMLPAHWEIRYFDRNVVDSEAEFDRLLGWADLMLSSGMLPQQIDHFRVIEQAKASNVLTVVGGPDASSSPHLYQRADFRVVGEAEGCIDALIAAVERGERQGEFHTPMGSVDITRSPIPRFDLLDFASYLEITVQFSRGCPFRCEFCDIIELYGRVPRAKTNAQMLAELDALYAAGYRGHVDFVDDILIGNKKALKRFLPELHAWQRKHRYPFEFSTEASMNLADDRELLEMLREANFFAIFVGIESPDTETLISTQKKQNTRRSLADSVHKIYAAGMFVIAGFIVGFDTEKTAVAEAMVDCIEATSIPVAMVGLLTALPNTQLTRRLEREGRLLPFLAGGGDQCSAGLNFVTLRPRRDVLADFRAILSNIYDPAAYFARIRHLARVLDRPHLPDTIVWKTVRKELRALARTFWAMNITRPQLRRHFWATVADCLCNKPRNFEYVVEMSAFYLHLGAFAQVLIKDLDRQIADLDAGVALEAVPLVPAA